MSNLPNDSILIVDDNPTNIKVLFKILTESEFKITIAKSGESALEKIKLSLPDLILLDVMMPGLDGFETCRRLKNNPQTKDIPIIFMTALSDTVDKVKGLQLGAVDYITKPIEHQEAIARIKVHLSLRQAQIKLVQEEKMSSLGQLLAGVAHEINNPINFIHGNLNYAQKYVTDLLELLKLYEKYLTQNISTINEFSQKIDLPFLKQDLPQLLASTEMGANRVKEIVRSLRVFSRLDEQDLNPIDLHSLIDSTLIILSSRLKVTANRPQIEVVKDYGNLPTVLCYPGKLSQVFMNLLANAIDAIEEKIDNLLACGSEVMTGWINGDINKYSQIAQSTTILQDNTQPQIEFIPRITIKTALSTDNTSAIIKITDNGTGISPSILEKIFEQFFTTKSVGKGTGLGLAIAQQIVVEKHKGNLEVNSTLGQGTEFVITIPII